MNGARDFALLCPRSGFRFPRSTAGSPEFLAAQQETGWRVLRADVHDEGFARPKRAPVVAFQNDAARRQQTQRFAAAPQAPCARMRDVARRNVAFGKRVGAVRAKEVAVTVLALPVAQHFRARHARRLTVVVIGGFYVVIGGFLRPHWTSGGKKRRALSKNQKSGQSRRANRLEVHGVCLLKTPSLPARPSTIWAMEISAVESESFRIAEGEREGKPFVGAQNAALMAFQHDAARGVKQQCPADAQSPRSRMRDGDHARKGRRKGVSAIGTQDIRVAQFASPAPCNICARHALRVRDGRGGNKRARCSQHQQGASQPSAPKTAEVHGSGYVFFQSLHLIVDRNRVMVRFPAFYAIERHRWRFSRRFKIIVAQDALCGAHVGERSDAASDGAAGGLAGVEAGVFGCVFALLLIPITLMIEHYANRRYQEREDLYLSLDPLGPQFLAQDKANFRLSRLQIASISFVPRSPLFQMKPAPLWNMEIRDINGNLRRFSLSSTDKLEDAVEKVRKLGIHVTVRN